MPGGGGVAKERDDLTNGHQGKIPAEKFLFHGDVPPFYHTAQRYVFNSNKSALQPGQIFIFTAALIIAVSLLLESVNLVTLLAAALILFYGIAGAYQPAVQGSVAVCLPESSPGAALL